MGSLPWAKWQCSMNKGFSECWWNLNFKSFWLSNAHTDKQSCISLISNSFQEHEGYVRLCWQWIPEEKMETLFLKLYLWWVMLVSVHPAFIWHVLLVLLNMPAKLRKPLLIHQDIRSISFLVTQNENPFFWRNEHVSIWQRHSFNSVQGHRVIVTILLTKSGRQNWHPGVDQCGQGKTQTLNKVLSLVLINLMPWMLWHHP